MIAENLHLLILTSLGECLLPRGEVRPMSTLVEYVLLIPKIDNVES